MYKLSNLKHRLNLSSAYKYTDIIKYKDNYFIEFSKNSEKKYILVSWIEDITYRSHKNDRFSITVHQRLDEPHINTEKIEFYLFRIKKFEYEFTNYERHFLKQYSTHKAHCNNIEYVNDEKILDAILYECLQ